MKGGDEGVSSEDDAVAEGSQPSGSGWTNGFRYVSGSRQWLPNATTPGIATTNSLKQTSRIPFSSSVPGRVHLSS